MNEDLYECFRINESQFISKTDNKESDKNKNSHTNKDITKLRNMIICNDDIDSTPLQHVDECQAPALIVPPNHIPHSYIFVEQINPSFMIGLDNQNIHMIPKKRTAPQTNIPSNTLTIKDNKMQNVRRSMISRIANRNRTSPYPIRKIHPKLALMRSPMTDRPSLTISSNTSPSMKRHRIDKQDSISSPTQIIQNQSPEQKITTLKFPRRKKRK